MDPDAPLQMLVTTLGYDNYRGVTAVGRIFAGRMHGRRERGAHDVATATSCRSARAISMCTRGLERVEVEQAEAGEIVAIAGLEGIAIGETLADPENPGGAAARSRWKSPPCA